MEPLGKMNIFLLGFPVLSVLAGGIVMVTKYLLLKDHP
jgi:hypothetical protein